LQARRPFGRAQQGIPHSPGPRGFRRPRQGICRTPRISFAIRLSSRPFFVDGYLALGWDSSVTNETNAAAQDRASGLVGVTALVNVHDLAAGGVVEGFPGLFGNCTGRRCQSTSVSQPSANVESRFGLRRLVVAICVGTLAFRTCRCISGEDQRPSVKAGRSSYSSLRMQSGDTGREAVSLPSFFPLLHGGACRS
jgi:hypothetical protein